MKKLSKTKNVVQATNVGGLADKLEIIQSQLSLCEKGPFIYDFCIFAFGITFVL